LEIHFLAELNNGLNGFYKTTYFDEETNSTETVATTKFGSAAARKAMPCFDEPAFKAVFQVPIFRMSISAEKVFRTCFFH
jgi:aminopeptidase N